MAGSPFLYMGKNMAKTKKTEPVVKKSLTTETVEKPVETVKKNHENVNKKVKFRVFYIGKYGRFEAGEEYTVPADFAGNLIKNGDAVEV